MSSVALCQKEFIKALNSFHRWGKLAAWHDFIMLLSSSLLLITGQDDTAQKHICEINDKYDDREISTMKKMMILMGDAYEASTDHDFFGEIMMKEHLGNDGAKQIFTPYSICKLMAALNDDFEEQLKIQNYISFFDPCCGSGSLLIAAANRLKEKGIPYQSTVWFVAQDVDYMAAMVCYIQLSILGCPGYIAWGNSLTHPAIGPLLNPIRSDSPEIFYTIQSFVEPWPIRKQLELAKILTEYEQKSPDPPDTDTNHIDDDDACSA